MEEYANDNEILSKKEMGDGVSLFKKSVEESLAEQNLSKMIMDGASFIPFGPAQREMIDTLGLCIKRREQTVTHDDTDKLWTELENRTLKRLASQMEPVKIVDGKVVQL
jgi:hypothetical protein